MSTASKIRVVTLKEADGFAYTAAQGDVTVHGWSRGTKREAEQEGKRHLRATMALRKSLRDAAQVLQVSDE